MVYLIDVKAGFEKLKSPTKATWFRKAHARDTAQAQAFMSASGYKRVELFAAIDVEGFPRYIPGFGI